MRNRAFSFIEFLVVVAIIAILAAMIIPAVHRAKAKQAAAPDKHDFIVEANSPERLAGTSYDVIIFYNRETHERFMIVHDRTVSATLALTQIIPSK